MEKEVKNAISDFFVDYKKGAFNKRDLAISTGISISTLNRLAAGTIDIEKASFKTIAAIYEYISNK